MSSQQPARLQDAVTAVIAAANSWTSGVEFLEGPLEQEIRDAADACWTFEVKPLQVGNKFLLQRRNVRVTAATLLTEAEEEQLAGALSQWLKSAEGAVASTGLELRIAEGRLLHSVHQSLVSSSNDAHALLAALDALLAAHSTISHGSSNVTGRTRELLERLSLQIGSAYSSSLQGASAADGQNHLISTLRRHAGKAAFSASLLQSPIEILPSILPAILCQEPAAQDAPGNREDSPDQPQFRAQALLLQQLPWEEVAKLGEDELVSNVIATLMGFADQLSRSSPGSPPEWAEAANVLLQVLTRIAAANKGRAGEAACGVILAFLTSLARGTPVKALLKSLGVNETSGHGLAGVSVIDWAQLLWRCPSGSSETSTRLVQELPWAALASFLPGKLRVRASLTLLAALKAGGQGGGYGLWLWRLLEGPTGDILFEVDSQDLAEDAHALCMTQAPGSRPDVEALWAWIQLRLSLSLFGYKAPSSASNGGGGTAGDVQQPTAGTVFGHIEGLMEAMQLWRLFDVLIESGNAGAAAKLLVSVHRCLAAQNAHRNHVGEIARVLSAALQAEPHHAEAVCGLLRGSITAVFEAPQSIAPTTGPEPAQKQAVPRKQYHAPAERGSTEYPGTEAMAAAADWTAALVLCFAHAGPPPPPAAALLSDLTQLLYYHPQPPADETDAASLDFVRDLPQKAAAIVVAEVKRGRIPRMFAQLMDAQKAAPLDLQWLPVLACWLSAAAESGDGAHLLSSATEALGGTPNERAEEALQIQAAALALGYSGAAYPLWRQFLRRFLGFQTQVAAVVPTPEISQHLAQLGQLYEAQSPLLADVYSLWATLDPESLSGGGDRDTEILRALMQLHPIKLKPGAAAKQQGPGAKELGSLKPLDRRPAVDGSLISLLAAEQVELAKALQETQRAMTDWAGNSTAASSQFPAVPPEPLARALAAVWAAQAQVLDELEMLQAGLRELVQRRYTNADVKSIEAGDYGDAEEVVCKEDPGYESAYVSNRERALSAMASFAAGGEVAQAASLLFQVEAVLFQSGGGSDSHPSEATGSLSLSLLDALADTIVDPGSPSVVGPYLTALFEKAAAGALGPLPQALPTRVGLLQRIVRALGASGGARGTEAAVLTNFVAGSQQPAEIAAVGTCLAAVIAALDPAADIPPAVLANLLACFDTHAFSAALMARPGQPSGLRPGVEDPAPSAAGPGAPPLHVADLMGLASALLSLLGGLQAGTGVLEGLLAPRHGPEGSSGSSGAGAGHHLFAAALAVCLPAWKSTQLDAVLRPLLQCELENMPLPVALESISQVTNQIQDAPAATTGVPHVLLRPLVRCTSVVRCLRAAISGSSQADLEDGVPCWTASLSAIGRQQELPVVLLSTVRQRCDAGEVLEALLGACLQSVLEKHGSGLEGTALTQEFDQLLSLIVEPAAEHPWMVDWLWVLYKSHLRPFLALAGDASGGAAVTSFREFWASLPWAQATFHTVSPDAVADLGSHILNADRAILQLLHALTWGPVLSQLDSLAARDPLVSRRACRWGTQLACLALRAYILLEPDELPAWLQAMVDADGAERGQEGVPGLGQLLSSLDTQGLMQLRGVLCSRLGGVPFLLQPLVVSPLLVQADPGRRLLHVSKLLAAAAAARQNAQLSALAAAAIRTTLLVTVSSGLQAPAELQPCNSWRLSDAQHVEVVTTCLLPLAKLHANLNLAMTARGERPGGQSLLLEPSGGVSQASASNWRPPQLSQLAGRVGVGGGGQHWGDPPAAARPPGRSGGADSADAALPLAALLDLLREGGGDVIRTADALPFANVPASGNAAGSQSRDSSGEGAGFASGPSRDSFLQSSVQRFRQRLEGGSPKARASQIQQPPPDDTQVLQLRLAEEMRAACREDANLALCTMRLLLTSSGLRHSTVPTALQEAVVLDLAVAASEGAPPPQLDLIFEGLGEGEIMGICHDACIGSAPLTQAAVSLALLRTRAVQDLERSAWRLLAAEVVKMASQAQARADAPTHILALWLVVLEWVGDTRWRSAQSSSSGVLEGFLDSLQGHTDVLRQAGRLEKQHSQEAGEEKGSLVSAATGRLRGLRLNLQSKLQRSDSGCPPDFAPDPSVPTEEFSPRAQQAMGLQPPQAQAGEATSAAGKAGKKLMGFGRGLKRMVGGAVEGESKSRFFGGFKAAPEEAVRWDPESEAAASESPGSARERGSGEGAASGFLGRTRERLRRGLARDRPPLEDAELQQLAALQEPVALGLAAFAVQAYLKSVLCPSLSDYTPRTPTALRLSAGALSTNSSLGGGLDSHFHKSSLGSLGLGIPRANLSVGSTLSSGAVLDEAAMRELDQLMEARTELDALDELLSSPAVVADPQRWAPFFAATPQLLSSATSVPQFQQDLMKLLFPGEHHLNLAACFPHNGTD